MFSVATPLLTPLHLEPSEKPGHATPRPTTLGSGTITVLRHGIS
jgi:hypothetical protein